MNTPAIENMLRNAPRPSAPAGLRERLCAQSPRRPMSSRSIKGSLSTKSSAGWLRRWWPALAPTAVSLACATVFTLQQSELRALKTGLRPAPAESQPSAPSTRPKPQDSASVTETTAAENAEIVRLKALAAQLNSEISRLEQLKRQNEELLKQLAARSVAAFSPEETKAMEDARDRSLSIVCVNNLKQLGLAVKMWSTDHGDITPPNVQSLTDYVGSFTKVFLCPADTRRQAASDATSLTPATCSYEYLAASTPDTEANRGCVLFRCPIHGHVGLIDGSVQSNLARNHPESLVQRDGRLYMQQTSPPPGAESGPAAGANPNQ